jgi:hypothetical protein
MEWALFSFQNHLCLGLILHNNRLSEFQNLKQVAIDNWYNKFRAEVKRVHEFSLWGKGVNVKKIDIDSKRVREISH